MVMASDNSLAYCAELRAKIEDTLIPCEGFWKSQMLHPFGLGVNFAI